jgi:hypothetical protein
MEYLTALSLLASGLIPVAFAVGHLVGKRAAKIVYIDREIQITRPHAMIHSGSAICSKCQNHVARYITHPDGSYSCANCEPEEFLKAVTS